jgi:VWFA-related protein
MRLLQISVIAALIAAPVVAQQKLVESIEVRVVNVDVVVSDRSGHPITGLTRDDFQLFENGRSQAITNFYEVRPEALPLEPSSSAPTAAQPAPAAAVPEEARARRFILFVDNYSIHPFKRDQILKSLEKFVDEQLRPDDEVELVLWTRSLSVVTPFTTDRKALKGGMTSLTQRSRSGISMQLETDAIKRRCQEYFELARAQKMSWAQAYSMAHADVNAYSDQVWGISKALLEAMRLTMTTLAGLEGKKVFVFAGAHLPEKPGLELQAYIYSLFSPFMKNLSPSEGISEASSRSQTVSIDKLAHQANADGVTFYMIDAADDRDFTSAEESKATDPTEQFLAFTNTAAAYQRLASMTGGIALTNTQNFDAAFQTVARDLGAYYSLGYKPADDKPGNRRLVVKTKNSAYQIRSRETYSPKTAEENISDRVVANIYHAGVKSEWPVQVRVRTAEKSGDRFSVPIEMTMPSTVTLLPQGEELVGGFNVYIAVGNDNGAMSKVMKSVQPIRIPRTAEAQLRGKPLVFTARIVVRPGESTLSVAAVDQISNVTGFARTRIAAR